MDVDSEGLMTSELTSPVRPFVRKMLTPRRPSSLDTSARRAFLYKIGLPPNETAVNPKRLESVEPLENNLKRSSSAPQDINKVGISSETETPSSWSLRPFSPDPWTSRRSSELSDDESESAGECVSRKSSGCASVGRPPIPTKRIYSIRRESSVRRCMESEVANERLIRCGSKMSHSFEDFHLREPPTSSTTQESGATSANNSSVVNPERRRANSLTEPMYVLTNFLPSSSSPSPTRVDLQKQCYSPKNMQFVRNNVAFSSPSPSPTPSPTRRNAAAVGIMRSLSPIAIRSSLAMKRRHHPDSIDVIDYCSSPKRFGLSPCPSPLTPDKESSAGPAIHHIERPVCSTSQLTSALRGDTNRTQAVDNMDTTNCTNPSLT